MKKLLLTTILMTSMIACYKDDTILNESPQDPLTKSQAYRSGNEYVKMKRHKITPNRALTIAEEAKALFNDENERLLRTRSIGLALAPIAITSQAKGRSAGGVDTLLYIVNYSNNNGFVFVSNDDRDGEVLMYAGGGNFAMQDTTGNPGLKLHVEMVLAYQAHKLNEIKSAEARGEEYIGGMTTTMLMAPNDVATFGVGQPGGMPGGPQGHSCNVTGQPGGMPGVAGTPARKDICAPATYESKNWFGNMDAIELAQKKYRNQKCFGVPVLPPSINFMTSSVEHGYLGTPGEAPLCESKPYCVPPLWNYKEYYGFYGCKMSLNYKNVRNELKQEILPLVTTFWHQHEPFRYGKPAGCGPLALMELMAYHSFPKTYYNDSFGRFYDTNLNLLRNYVTNDDLLKSTVLANNAKVFCNEIGDRLNVMYFKGGSAVPGLVFGAKILRETLQSFGYSANESDTWNYKNDYNFITVVNSLTQKLPVLIYGFPEGRNGVIKVGEGHIWLLDGYRKTQSRYYYADYYFDEYGKFNAENRYIDYMTNEYVHGNMGWGKQDETDYWVHRNVYNFGNGSTDPDYDFCNKIYFIAYIKPNE